MSPEGYELKDGRFVQELQAQTAADALSISVGPVPNGKVWTILSAKLFPGVAETRTVWFAILTLGGTYYPVTAPVTILLNTIITFPMVTEGMEIKLYQTERLYAFRDVATAGSSFYIRVRIIETDLPYYSYEDPLKKVIAQSQKHGSLLRGAGGGAGGGGRPAGGGGGGPKPI
ncbi:hypothetical protein MUP46_03750 [Patescibacteria group bacterium]|nr:hypothetical protein [Patescibacteria group bacterium]